MEVPSATRFPRGKTAGGLATILGVVAGVVLLFGPIGRYESGLSDGTREKGTISGIDYLLGAEHADPALFFWSLLVLGVSLVGEYGVLTGNRRVVWAVAILMPGFSIIALASIGLFVAPAALLFLATGVLLSYAHRNE